MRPLAFLLVAGILLAGCSGTSTDTSSSTAMTSGSGTSGPTSTGSSSATTTGTTTAPTLAPPSAVLNANRTSGTLPFAVMFNLTGGAADGSDVTYSLDFADASAPSTGTRLPAEVAHTFALAGNYTVRLTVTDRAGRSANATTLITALSAGAATPAGPILDVTASWTASMGGAIEFGFGCYDTSTFCASLLLPPAAPGRPFTATFSATVPAAVYWMDTYSGGKYVDTFLGDPGATTISDVVPAGIDEFQVYATGGAMHTVHLVIP